MVFHFPWPGLIPKSRYQRNVEYREMVIIHRPFPGETNDRSGKEDADDDADDVGEKRYEEACPLRMLFYNLCKVLTHRYPIPYACRIAQKIRRHFRVPRKHYFVPQKYIKCPE